MTDDRESELARLRGELAGLESAYEAQCARAEKAERELDERFEALIERSSLGTPEAKEARSRTPPAVVDEILRRVQAARRRDAYELVERELRERGVTKVTIKAHVICAVRAGVELTERAPMPTLIGAVDLLGEP